MALADARAGALLCALAISGGPISRAAGTASPPALDVEQPVPGVYVHLGKPLALDAPGHDDIANIGFIVGKRCVAVIDTGGSVRQGRALRTALRGRSALPICYVINTHVHVDHVLGDFAFKDDKPSFVGHAALADEMARNRPYFLKEYAADFQMPASGEQVIAPDRLVERDLTIDLGDRPLHLHAWPKAHTDSDLSVYDERTATLWTGDLLFRERLPALDGSVVGWLAVIGDLGALKAALVVPGHGPLARDLPDALAPERRYLESLRDGVRRELEQGESMQHAIAHVASDQQAQWLLWDEVHPRNVARAYEELEWAR